MRQVGSASGIAASNRTLLKMAFQDIATREFVFAENAHIRPITRV